MTYGHVGKLPQQLEEKKTEHLMETMEFVGLMLDPPRHRKLVLRASRAAATDAEGCVP